MRAKKKALPPSHFDEIVAEIVHLLVSEVDTDKLVTEDKFVTEDKSVTEDKFITEDKSATEVVVRSTDQADKLIGTEILVRSTIQFLKTLDRGKPLWGLKRSNTDALSAFRKNIGDLRKTLSKFPGELLVLLAVKRLSEQVPSSLEQQNASARLEKIVATLNYLQTRCDDLLNQQPGEHRSADFTQRLVAEQAWRLMKYHDLKPTIATMGRSQGFYLKL